MSSDPEPDGSGGSGAGMGILRTVVPDFIRRRFALKFLLVLLVMGTAIGAIGVVATGEVTDQTQQRIETEYKSLAAQEANLLDQWINRNRLTTKQTAGSNVLQTNDSTVIRSLLQERLENDMASDVNGLYVFERTAKGDEIIASNLPAPSATMSQSGRAWVNDVQIDDQEDVHISSVYSLPTVDQTVVGFVAPVDGTENRYLLMEVSTQSITSQFQGSDRAKGGFTQVVNKSGTVMMDEKAANGSINQDDVLKSYGDQDAQQPLRAAFELTDEPSGVIPRMPANDGVMSQEYTVGYAPVIISGHHENWAVLVHGPTSVVFGFVQTVSDWGLIATAAGVLLIGLIGAALGFNTSRSIDRVTGIAEEMEQGNLDVEINSGRIDNIGRLYDGFDQMRDALKEQISEAERARKEAEVSRAEAMEMSTYLQERAETYSEIMQACARGDLTRRMEPEGENEAMDQIAEDFNEMVTELEMTTGQLKTFAVEVEEAGRGVQQSAETVRDASEQVADSIQKISDDAYDQKERLQSISEDMDMVADQLDEFSQANPDVDFGDSLATVRNVASTLDEAVDLGEQTMAESENVAGAAEEQAAELNEVSSRAEELVRYAQYLGDGLNNFETEEEHEFVFQTGAGSPGPREEASGPGE